MTNNKEDDIDKDFCRTYNGQLQKYTNVMKGWCPRWFILDPGAGMLDYYLTEAEVGEKPRGSLHLVGAVVSPSDEDSHTFTVNSAGGEFKLRACDAKERQVWVNRLRAVIAKHDGKLAANARRNRPPPWRGPSYGSPWDSYAASVYLRAMNPTPKVTDWANAHAEADQQIRLIGDLFDLIQRETDELPSTGEMSSSNNVVMKLAATSLLTLHTLQDAIRLLEIEAYRPSVLE